MKGLKRVVSVSLGSSRRDHTIETKILQEDFVISRRGTDGDLKKARDLLHALDGQVDALGLGGIDLYIRAGDRRYTLRDAKKLIRRITKTPVVDGSGLKDTLEKEIIRDLSSSFLDLSSSSILLVCGMDRPGMAEAFQEVGQSVVYGDLIFILGLPIPIKSPSGLMRMARLLAPLVCQLPIKYLYPIGEKQNRPSKDRFSSYLREAQVIAGDFHLIKKNLPPHIPEKIIITNTVTAEDVEDLRARGAYLLVTTTPDLGGRSFGTNVIEAILVALQGKGREELSSAEYSGLIKRLDLKPRIEVLQNSSKTKVLRREKGEKDA